MTTLLTAAPLMLWLLFSFQGMRPVVLLSTCIVLLYTFAILHALPAGMLIVSVLPPAYGFFRLLQGKGMSRQDNLLWLITLILTFLYTYGFTLSVIDEHVYWAIMPKSIFLEGHLPETGTTIIPRHLTYTPGTSLLIAFAYQLTGTVNLSIAYFMQAIYVLSALMLIITPAQRSRTLVMAIILIIVSHLIFGSVLGRLDVDVLLSVLCFTALVLLLPPERDLPKYCAALSVLLSLSLVKEIGLLLAAATLIIAFLTGIRENNKSALLFCLISTVLLIAIRLSWQHYTQAQGFEKFLTPMNTAQLHGLLWPSGTQLTGLLIVLKSMMLGTGDRLNLPLIFWWIALPLMWHKTSTPIHQRIYLHHAAIVLAACLLIYAFMLYIMQVHTFQVGLEYKEAVSMRRYMAIGYAHIALFVIFRYLDATLPKSFTRKNMGLIIVLFLCLLALSKQHRQQVDIQYKEGLRFAQSLQGKTPGKVCYSAPSDYFMAEQLRYYFLSPEWTFTHIGQADISSCLAIVGQI